MQPNAGHGTRYTGHGTWKYIVDKSQGQEDDFHAEIVCQLFVKSDADLAVFPRSALHIQFVSTTTFSFRCIFALTSVLHRPQCVATQIGTRKSALQNAATHAFETRFGARARHALGCNAAAQRAARGSNTLLTLILYYGRVCMCVCGNVC